MFKVLVLVNNPILGEAIEELLKREDGFSVVRIPSTIGTDLWSHIIQHQPAVAIFEEGLIGINLAKAAIFESEHSFLRILTIRLEHNQLEFIDIYRLPISGLEDLIIQAKDIRRMQS